MTVISSGKGEGEREKSGMFDSDKPGEHLDALNIRASKTPWDRCTVHSPLGDNRVVTENGGLSGI